MKANTYLFKRIRKKGYLMVGYTFIKALGTTTAVVLERLLTEYQHAIRHNFWCTDEAFCFDADELSFHLGLSIDELVDSITKIRDLNLIYVDTYKGLYFVKINEEEIVNFEKTTEIENDYKMWDYNLYSVQSRVDNLSNIDE
jgi:hypothetical protein